MLFLYWKRSLFEFILIVSVFVFAVIYGIAKEEYKKLNRTNYYMALLMGAHFLVFLYLHELKDYPLTYPWMLIELAVFIVLLAVSTINQGIINTIGMFIGVYLAVWIVWAIISMAWHLGMLFLIVIFLIFIMLGANM